MSDPQFSDVVSLAHFEEVGGTPVDVKGHTWTQYNGAVVGGTTVLYETGSGDSTGGGTAFWDVDTNTVLNAEYTVELSIRVPNLAATKGVWQYGGSGADASNYNLCLLNTDGSLNWQSVVGGSSNGNITSSAGVITLNTTHDLRFVVEGGTGYIFVDGVQVGSGPMGAAASTNSGFVGYAYTGTAYYLGGYVDEWRITNASRGTGNYTPSFPFPDTDAPSGPTITTQPQNASVTDGSAASFTVAATGTGTLSYQWYETTAGLLSGETSTTLSITTSLSDDGNGYYCAVTDDNGTTNSNTASLTVTPAQAGAPIIYRQPESVTAINGEQVNFSCQAVGDPPLTFQWYEATAGALAGETDTVLTLTAQNSMTGNGYYCIVTSAGVDSTQSDTATLSVGDQVLAITQQPASASVTEGDIASFTVRAVGAGTLTYQWKDQSGPIAGATSATYAFTTQLSDNGSTFDVDVTDDNGTLSSNTVSLAVYEDIGAEPEPDRGRRTALVWSFDNGTFTWQDASHATSGSFDPVVCMNYGFDIGWQIRWQSWLDDNTTWNDLLTAQTRWNDLYSAADEKFLFWLSTKNLLKSDQVIEKRNGKDYFVERRNVDFKDLTNWTSDSWKFMRQFVFHAVSDINTTVNTPNTFNLTVGWGSNLMDRANWEPPVVVSLNSPDRSGDYKADLRTTGRYLSIRMDFDDTEAISMTGGDMDLELTHGR